MAPMEQLLAISVLDDLSSHQFLNMAEAAPFGGMRVAHQTLVHMPTKDVCSCRSFIVLQNLFGPMGMDL